MTWPSHPDLTLPHQNAPNHGTKWPQKRQRVFFVSVLESHNLRTFSPPRHYLIEILSKHLIILQDMAKKRPQKRPQISPKSVISFPADSNPNQCQSHHRMHSENTNRLA